MKGIAAKRLEINGFESVEGLSQPTEPNRFVIARGQGRNRFSTFDFNSGYYFHRKITEAGHFWEYVAAVRALTQSIGTFVGVELASDFRTYLVPYYLAFEDELTTVFEAIINEDYSAYAPRIIDGKVTMLPAATISLTDGSEVDPRTGRIVMTSSGPVDDGPILNLDNWFTQRYYALFFSMSEFRSAYSLRYSDRFQIWRGVGEAVEPGPGHTVETCLDPISGHEYGTLRDASMTPEELEGETAGGLRAILRCQNAADAYVTMRDSNPDDSRLPGLLAELNDSVEWLNFMRSLYRFFGHNIF